MKGLGETRQPLRFGSAGIGCRYETTRAESLHVLLTLDNEYDGGLKDFGQVVEDLP